MIYIFSTFSADTINDQTNGLISLSSCIWTIKMHVWQWLASVQEESSRWQLCNTGSVPTVNYFQELMLTDQSQVRTAPAFTENLKVSLMQQLTSHLTAQEKHMVFYQTAVNFYGLDIWGFTSIKFCGQIIISFYAFCGNSNMKRYDFNNKCLGLMVQSLLKYF